MITARRSSLAFGTDPIAQSVRSTVSASARLEATVAAKSPTGAGLDVMHLYPAIFVSQPRLSMTAGYIRALFGALSAAGAAILAIVHR